MDPFDSIFFVLFTIFSVIIFFIHYAKNVDKKIQLFLKKKLRHSIEFRPVDIKRSDRYLKLIGETNFNGFRYQIYTNNLEAALNRQIIFETNLTQKSSYNFYVQRNIYSMRNDENIPGFEQFRIYNVKFSELGTIAAALGVMKSALEQKKNKPVYEMLHRNGIFEMFEKISGKRRMMGILVINQYWKFFVEEDRIGFLIDWGWLKEISQEDLRVFFDTVEKLSSALEKKDNFT